MQTISKGVSRYFHSALLSCVLSSKLLAEGLVQKDAGLIPLPMFAQLWCKSFCAVLSGLTTLSSSQHPAPRGSELGQQKAGAELVPLFVLRVWEGMGQPRRPEPVIG